MDEWISEFSKSFYNNFIYQDRYMQLLKGLSLTVKISFFALLIGTLLGIVIALMRISKNKVLSTISGLYITVIRGTPLLIQLMLIYFVVLKSVDNGAIVAIVAFSINSGGYVAEIIRAGILAIDKGQMEAGRSLGLNYYQTMRYIILPQAFKNIIPTYTSEFIVLIKETSIVGYIALMDLTKAGDFIRSRTYDAFLPLIAVALIYLTMTTFLSWIFSKIERRLRAGDTH